MIPMLDDVTLTEERIIITHITLELGTAGIAKVLKIARMLKYKDEFDFLTLNDQSQHKSSAFLFC